MSSKQFAQSLTKEYNKIVAFCKILDIKQLPYPKTPLKTDEELIKYHKSLRTYMNTKDKSKVSEYKFENISNSFPNKFFT